MSTAAFNNLNTEASTSYVRIPSKNNRKYAVYKVDNIKKYVAYNNNNVKTWHDIPANAVEEQNPAGKIIGPHGRFRSKCVAPAIYDKSVVTGKPGCYRQCAEDEERSPKTGRCSVPRLPQQKRGPAIVGYEGPFSSKYYVEVGPRETKQPVFQFRKRGSPTKFKRKIVNANGGIGWKTVPSNKRKLKNVVEAEESVHVGRIVGNYGRLKTKCVPPKKRKRSPVTGRLYCQVPCKPGFNRSRETGRCRRTPQLPPSEIVDFDALLADLPAADAADLLVDAVAADEAAGLADEAAVLADEAAAAAVGAAAGSVLADQAEQADIVAYLTNVDARSANDAFNEMAAMAAADLPESRSSAHFISRVPHVADEEEDIAAFDMLRDLDSDYDSDLDLSGSLQA